MGKVLAASPRQSRREGVKRIGKLPKVVSDKSYTGLNTRAAPESLRATNALRALLGKRKRSSCALCAVRVFLRAQ